MMEWCTDVVVSSSSFLSLSLGSSFFWIPKQSVQSSKIKPQQVQRFTLWPFPSSVWELNHKNTKQGKNARCTWVSAFLSVKRYLLIFYHLIPHLAQSLRRERPLTTRDRKPFLKSYEFTSLFFYQRHSGWNSQRNASINNQAPSCSRQQWRWFTFTYLFVCFINLSLPVSVSHDYCPTQEV